VKDQEVVIGEREDDSLADPLYGNQFLALDT